MSRQDGAENGGVTKHMSVPDQGGKAQDVRFSATFEGPGGMQSTTQVQHEDDAQPRRALSGP